MDEVIVSQETFDWLQRRLEEPPRAIPALVELFKEGTRD